VPLGIEELTVLGFIAMAVTLLILERFSSMRRSLAPVQDRWLTNIGLMFLGGFFIALLFPASLGAVAGDMPGGLIRDLQWPLWLETAVVFLLLDCWRYWEHRAFHEIPLLWRLHLVHHSDTAVDVTTAERHHPFERILGTLLAFMLVFALGFSVQAVGLYLFLATLAALYSHGNITLPEVIDQRLRRLLVTPSVHHIHHSSYQPETDSNYGSVLTVWDRLFGTYTEPSSTRVTRVGLESFRLPRDRTLASALVQPFLAWRDGGAPEPTGQPARATGGAVYSRAWLQALFLGGVGLVLALAALWPTVLDMTRLWSSSEPYQYAWLVLPMFIYVLGWHHRDTLLAMPPRPGYAGLPLILLATIVWLVASVVEINLGEQLALVLVLQGLALCTVGWRVYRAFLPAMLLLFLMVPSGDILQPLLQNLTVKWVEWFSLAAGLPHSVEGYVIHVGTQRYVVVAACSGLTFFTLAGFLGYSFGLLLFRSLPKVLALAALGAALGILVNAVRVCVIVALDWMRGSQMDLAAHADIQWIVLLMALGALLYIASRLAHEDWSQGVATEGGPLPRGVAVSFAPVIAGAILPLFLGLWQVQAHRAEAPGSGGPDRMQQVADGVIESHWLSSDPAGNRALSIPLGPTMDVVMVAPDAGSNRLDESFLRPAGDVAWRRASTGRYRDCSIEPCMEFVHTTWNRKGSPEVRQTFYSYYVGELATDSRLAYRLASGWNRMAATGLDRGLIGFRLAGDPQQPPSLGALFQRFRAGKPPTLQEHLAASTPTLIGTED